MIHLIRFKVSYNLKLDHTHKGTNVMQKQYNDDNYFYIKRSKKNFTI